MILLRRVERATGRVAVVTAPGLVEIITIRAAQRRWRQQSLTLA